MLSRENGILKNKLTSPNGNVNGLQQEVCNLEGEANILKRANEKLILKNKKLVENTTIAKFSKYVENLKHENDTLHTVLNKKFKENKHLGLLKCCKHSSNKGVLGFNDDATHSNPNPKSIILLYLKRKSITMHQPLNREK